MSDDLQVVCVSCDPMFSLRAWADPRATSSRCCPTTGRTARSPGVRRAQRTDRRPHPRHLPRSAATASCTGPWSTGRGSGATSASCRARSRPFPDGRRSAPRQRLHEPGPGPRGRARTPRECGPFACLTRSGGRRRDADLRGLVARGGLHDLHLGVVRDTVVGRVARAERRRGTDVEAVVLRQRRCPPRPPRGWSTAGCPATGPPWRRRRRGRRGCCRGSRCRGTSPWRP